MTSTIGCLQQTDHQLKREKKIGEANWEQGSEHDSII